MGTQIDVGGVLVLVEADRPLLDPRQQINVGGVLVLVEAFIGEVGQDFAYLMLG